MADISKLVLEIDSSGVKVAAGNLNKFAEAALNAQGEVNTLDGLFGKLKLSSLAGAAGVSALVAAMGNFGKSAIQTYSSFEQIQNGLGGVLKDAQKGKEMFEDLRKFSFSTTFGVDTLSAAASQLLNVGVAANKIKPSLKMLGDVAGGDTTKFNELTEIFAKIQNTGKATSVQLQQLALRGVPIYQVLKEIGVQGNATADDITRAFEQMTSASGQFYNNMESINDTIAGKQGFVSDTWRELLASFAEASGLAQVYKVALDVVYTALQNIVNALAVINENPVYRTIFQGVLIGAVTTLAVTIGTSLVGALTAVVGKLTAIAALKAVINPASIAIGVGVAAAAIGGLAIGMSNYEKAQEAAARSSASFADEMQKIAPVSASVASSLNITTNAMHEQVIAIGDAEIAIKDLVAAEERAETKEFRKEYKAAKKAAKGHDSILDSENQDFVQYDYVQEEANLNKLIRLKAEYESQGMSSMWYDYGYEEEFQAQKQIVGELENKKKLIEELNAVEDEANRKHEERVRAVAAANEEYANALAMAESIYANTEEGKKEKLKEQIAYLKEAINLRKKSLKTVPNGAGGVEKIIDEGGYNAKEIATFNAAIKSLEDQLNGTTKSAEKNVKELASWQKVMQSLFSFSDSDVAKHLDTQIHGLEEYVRRVKEEADTLQPYWELINGNKTKAQYDADNAKALYENDAKMLQSLLSARDEKTGNLIWSKDDESIKTLIERVKQLKQESQDIQFDLDYENLVKEGKQLGKNARELEVMTQMAKGYSEAQARTYAAEKFGQLYKEKSAALAEQWRIMGKTTEELRKQELIKEGIAEKDAESLANAQAMYDKAKELASASYLDNKFSSMVQMSAESYNANGRTGLDVGEYAKGKAGQAFMGAVQGSDVGNAIQGFQEGGVWGAVINTLVNALAKVCGSMEEFDALINPVTKWMQQLKPLLKALMDQGIMANEFIGAILQLLQPLINAVSKVIQAFNGVLGGFLGTFKSVIGVTETLEVTQSDYDDELKRQLDHMKALNDQYKSLQSAIDEQEQYYLRKKMEVNAQAYDRALSSTQVNDMILTPKGNFSTDPNDYIIATKNPAGLGGGGTVIQMNVKISNTMSDSATVKTTQTTNADGMPELLVMVSRKVAGDAASGSNGWDDALNAREQRLSGRRVMA